MLKHVWIALATALLLPAAAHAQHPLFTEDSELTVTLEAPISTIVRNMSRSTDAHPGALVLHGQGEPQRYELLVSARGFSRRTGPACTFPPLRIDFENNELRETIFRGQNRLKLVTHCRSNATYQRLYVLEYLAYRIYNEITPLSYRVRPLRVTYQDGDGRQRGGSYFAFVIEDVDDLARRTNRVELEVSSASVSATQLDPEAAATYALFQYMIGNLDWDMVESRTAEECCHNSRLLAASETARTAIVPAPYDFDYSGFVSAPYAIPPAGFSTSSVRTRIYRGYCQHNAQIPATIAAFQARRAAINALIAGEARLPESRRRQAQSYIDDFYGIIAEPAQVERLILGRCRETH